LGKSQHRLGEEACRVTASDEELRARIIDAAASLFAEHGFSGTRVRMVAKAAGVSSQTVRRLTGGRAQLFEAVITARSRSSAAERVRAAVEDPLATPPLAVMLAISQEVYQHPGDSWDILELEALTRAHVDEQVRAIETERMERRRQNAMTLVSQIRSVGGIDPDVSDSALTHLIMALGVGLAMLDPVIADKPSLQQWNSTIARVGAAMVPPDLELVPVYSAGKPWRVRAEVPDRPGTLSKLVRALGSLHTYTVGVSMVEEGEQSRTIDIALVAPESVSAEVLRAAAQTVGRHVYIGEGSEDDRRDLPTRVLNGATALVSHPDLAPVAAAQLVEADEFEVTDATQGEDDSPDVLRLQWTAEQHVVLQRSWAPFAAVERGRVSAFLRLSAAIAAALGNEDATGRLEAIKGGHVWIRLARPEDADAVSAMHERCSERSRYQRYFSLADWRGTRLYRLAGGHRGATLVVMSEDGRIVGLGNMFPDPSEGSGAAEVALIVEDEYQGRGVGMKLLTALLHYAVRLGFSEVVASVLAENKGMLTLMQRSGLDWKTRVEDRVAYMRAPLPERAQDLPGVGVRKRLARKPPTKKAAATKTPAKKAPAKKASPRKSPAKKASPRKSPAKKAPAPPSATDQP
jgi:AcrR family transcriptional regulator/RimJ/RimL family protein N-acetyltransferase